MKTIRAKLTAGMLAVIVIGMATVFLVSYFIARNIIIQESLEKNARTVNSEAALIDGWLSAQKATVDVFGADLIAINDLTKVKPLLESQAKANTNLVDIYIGLSDDSGIFAYWEAPPDWKATGRGWYQSGMAASETPATIVYSDFGTKILYTAFTKNIGKIQNLDTVLACDIELQTVADQVAGIGLGNGGYAFLVDDTGSILTHPDAKYAASEDSFCNVNDTEAYKTAYSNLKKGQTITKAKDYDGIIKYMVSCALDCGWVICAAIPADAVLDAFNNGIFWLFPILAVIILIAVFITSALIRRLIVKPIKHLVDVAGAVSEGNLSINWGTQSKDEIGTLQESFERLVNASRQQAELLGRIADGDLTGSYTPRSDSDVVGHSLVGMLERNNTALTQVLEVSNQLAGASREISRGSQTLAQGASEQSAATQELYATVSEITGMIHDGAKMVDKAADLSITIKGSAEKGNLQMNQMVDAIKDIRNASIDINKIMKVIDDIAFQTNILALNAAVEAARAGKHGKGFAVVADEVRNLASKSAAAAKDTGSLISDTMEKAELGVRITNETAVSLAEIVRGIGENGSIISDIAAAHKKQETAIDQINASIEQVAQVVHQNSATAEESAAASAEMTEQTNMLNESVAAFKLKGAGQTLAGSYMN